MKYFKFQPSDFTYVLHKNVLTNDRTDLLHSHFEDII